MARIDKAASAATSKRQYVSQTDIPAVSLREALRIPVALAEQYGKQPATPIEVAAALDISPTTGHFRKLTGAAVAYGVTEGGAYADVIGLTDIGRRIVAPMVEGDDQVAKREALLRPRIVREFLERYDGSPLPTETIGCNVLEGMGVPTKRTKQTLELIAEGAEDLGFIATIKGKKLVNLRATRLRVVPEMAPAAPLEVDEDDDDLDDSGLAAGAPVLPPSGDAPLALAPEPERNRRVFVSHGSNQQIVQHLKELLEYGEYQPVVSVERETTSKPVPEKVLDDMRSCAAGIIHVGVERVITDAEGAGHPQLNSNVLIEIGAAMALYGRNFILLVEEGTKLPSNLQGLYEVRYEGKSMDAGATMKLLKAFKDFKS
jgi:hypothetical protein